MESDGQPFRRARYGLGICDLAWRLQVEVILVGLWYRKANFKETVGVRVFYP